MTEHGLGLADQKLVQSLRINYIEPTVLFVIECPLNATSATEWRRPFVVTLETLAGLWRMNFVGRSGTFAPKEVIENSNLSIAIVGNSLTVTSSLEMCTFVLNNSVVPN